MRKRLAHVVVLTVIVAVFTIQALAIRVEPE